MTIYNAGLAKDCCDDFISVYFDFQIEQRRNNVNTLYSEFTATITADVDFVGGACELLDHSGIWRPCDSDPTDEFLPSQYCEDYFEIALHDKEFWGNHCNNAKKIKSIIEGEKTFKYCLINNYGLGGSSYGFAWISEKFELSTTEVRRKSDTRYYWLYECSTQVQAIIFAGASSPNETITAGFTLVYCDFSRDPNEFDEEASIYKCRSSNFDSAANIPITRGPITMGSKVYPSQLIAKNTAPIRYAANKEELFDCFEKSVAMNWNDEKAVYLSDWETCGNQPFRLIGYPSISTQTSRYQIPDASNCPLVIEKSPPFVTLDIQYPSYPYLQVANMQPPLTGHGNYSTAGFFECINGFTNCWAVQAADES